MENVGSTGQSGQNATPCKTNAADILCSYESAYKVLYNYFNWDYKFQKYVSDPRCPDKLLTSAEPIPQQNPRLPLSSIPTGIIAYKAILVENMNNFAFKNAIRKVYKAIESSTIE